MKIGISKNYDPFYNLAVEEIMLKDEDIRGEILLIYINESSIVFGRNQNIYEEANLDFVKENNIKLVRRVSGGGAVYHDKGNFCFSFITDNKPSTYKKFLEPIIDFLNSIGINAKFRGKNDVEVNGLKISGNAQYKYKDRMFHHGTFLYDVDFSKLSNSLKPSKLKLESKSIKSNRQRVTNVKPLLKEELSIDEFIKKMVDHFINKFNAEIIDIDNYKKDIVRALINTRRSKDWIFGKNPGFDVSNEKRFDGGTIKYIASIKNNKITNIQFTGDFLSSNNFEDIYKSFIGKEFDFNTINNLLNEIDGFDDYFGKLSISNILELIFEEK